MLKSITEVEKAIEKSDIDPKTKADALWYIKGLRNLLDYAGDKDFAYDEDSERYLLGEEGISDELGRFLSIYWSN